MLHALGTPITSRRRWTASAPLALALTVGFAFSTIPPAIAAPSGPVVLDFEDLSTGGPGGSGNLLAIFGNYGSQFGVLFNGPKAIDYSVGSSAIPGFAHSGTKAIEACISQEFCTVPIEMTFTAPQSRIKVFTGYSESLAQVTAVILSAFDASGNLVGTATAMFNASPGAQSIRTPLEVRSSNANIVRATVSTARGFNSHLAVDDVEFDIAGGPPICTTTQVPMVRLAPLNPQTVYTNDFILEGTISTGAQLQAATLTAQGILGGFSSMDLLSRGLVNPNGGNFSLPISEFLSPGTDFLSLTVRDCRGEGEGDAWINYTVPFLPQIFGTEITQGLPGYELIAGKSTLVRVFVGTTDPATPTRIDRALLEVRRPDNTYFTVPAEIPNPLFSNTTQQFSENTNINFYVSGNLLPAGVYAFTVHLYNGATSVATVNFDNRFYTFVQTPDLSLMIVLPDIIRYQRSLSDFVMLFDYLDDMARLFPVRDGWGLRGDSKGIQVSLRFFEPICDGSFPPTFPNCGPTQDEMDSDRIAPFKWNLVQPRATGQLRTLMPPFTTISIPCPGRNALYTYPNPAGRLALEFVPGIFVYFPGWLPNTADPIYDLNYDGEIDATELSAFVSEYYDTRRNDWSDILVNLQPGDVIHSFVDRNRNCKFDNGEAQAPFTQKKLVTWMYQKARALADVANMTYSGYVLWLDMDKSGTAGGTTSGHQFWAVLGKGAAFQHEFGHEQGMVASASPNSNGSLHSIHCQLNNPFAFDVVRRKAIVDAISLMGCGGAPDKTLIEEWDYNNLADRLRSSAIVAGTASAGAEKFMLNAYVDKEDHFRVIDSSIVRDLDTTSVATKSMYSLVFMGPGKKVALREPLQVEFESPSEQGHAHGTVYHYDAFAHVVRPLPARTVAVEARKSDRVLWHMDRQPSAPTVKIRDLRRNESSVEQGTQSETLNVSWNGLHPKGAKLTYNIAYSADGGKTWMGIATGMLQTNLNWDLRGAPGSDKAMIRVTASDGFNTASALSQTFRVEAKPPTAAILPSAYKEWPANRLVRLRGIGFDLQDGVLLSASMQWSCDGDRKLSTGSVFERFLRPGTHVITLRSSNSHGLTSEAKATVVVAPKEMLTPAEKPTADAPVQRDVHSAH
jgi:hypothetical protein